MKVKELIRLLSMCTPEADIDLMIVTGNKIACGALRSACIRVGRNGIVLSNQESDRWMERRKK